MSAIASLAGINSNPDTVIQNLSSSLRVASGRTSVENINLTVPSLGVLTGRGVVTSGNALDFRMLASVELSAKRTGPQKIPFLIQGTASDPAFLPDAKGMAAGALESIVGAEGSKGALGALDKLFKKKK
jgi:hypothetical protein